MKIELVGGSKDQGRVWTFEQPGDVTIGRGNDCSVHLQDAEASRHHAALTCRDNQWYVRDLGSKNGTRLNGEGVGEASVFGGDEIRVGGSVLVVTDIPARPMQPSSFLHFVDGDRAVVLTLNHQQADVLKGVVTSASVAEMAHENKVLREVARISQILAAKEDGSTILRLILDDMRRALGADSACVLTRPGDDDPWAVRAASGDAVRDGQLNVSQSIIRRAVEEGAAILMTDAQRDERFDASMSIVSLGVSAAMCTPLKVSDRFAGVLVLDRRRRNEAFDEMDLRLTATVGNLLGVFLEKEAFEAEAHSKARLAAIGEVVTGLAHHVKNIVTGFKLSIANLELAYKRQRMDILGSCLTSIVGLEQRISDLMLNMLSYAKDRAPCPTEIDVRRLFDDMLKPYAEQFETKGIRFVAVVEPGAERLHADERAIHTAFLNLILNAVDALEAKSDPQGKLITVNAAPAVEAGLLEFRVRDTGAGIAPENLSKLFRSFYSTKGSRGTGLGLAVLRKIVEEHHGQVSVDSVQGQWTEFRIVLPARQPDPPPAPATPATEA